MRKTDGFTLIELMVGIVCSALVTGAVITFMLAGMDTNRSVLDANADQRNAKIVISMMENLANEGSISKLEVEGALTREGKENLVDYGNRPWTLYGNGNVSLLSYSPDSKTIYAHGSVLMEGVDASMLSLSSSPLGGCILGFSMKTDESIYETSVYSRSSYIATDGEFLAKNNHFSFIDSNPDNNASTNDLPVTITPTAAAGRLALLQTLTSQYNSTGTIIIDGVNSSIPYSLWYCGGAYPETWDENTPWCAIFLSWGFTQIKPYLSIIPKAAEVYDPIYNPNYPSLYDQISLLPADTDPKNITPGDLIFFDWDRKGSSFNPQIDDLEHVGIVLSKNTTQDTDGNITNWIYTIEGNSGGRVALRRYALNDPSIHCYGILPWK